MKISWLENGVAMLLCEIFSADGFAALADAMIPIFALGAS